MGRGVAGRVVGMALCFVAFVAGTSGAASAATPWVKLCGKASQVDFETGSVAAGKKPDQSLCLTRQEIFDGRNGSLLVSAEIRKPEGSAKALLQVQVPTGLAMLPFGSQAKIDEGARLMLRFTFCHATGCILEADAPEEFINRMRYGKQLQIAVANPERKGIAFPVPLDGFGLVYDGPPLDGAQYKRDRKKLMVEIESRADGAPRSLLLGLPPAYPQAVAAQTPWVKICGVVPRLGATFFESDKMRVCLAQKEMLGVRSSVLFSVAMRRVEGQEKEQLEVLVPAGLARLEAGAQGRIDDNQPFNLRFLFCHMLGCIAEAESSPALLHQMKTGKKLVVTVQSPSRKSIPFAMPLMGFGDAYDGPSVDNARYNQDRKRLLDEIQARRR